MTTERATDPRLEQTVTEGQSNPPENQVSVGALEIAADDDTPVVDDQPVAEQPVETPKPKKSAEEVLKGRVGHLTKTLSTKDQVLTQREQELADYKSRLAAAEALLNSSGQTPPATPGTPPNLVANGNTTYTKEEFEAAVQAQAEIKEFDRRANEMYDQGSSKFTDWKDSVDTLVAAGFMNKDLLEAAMAVEDGTAVLHHLGTNLDEAERIAALPPIRKAAEMAKLSNQLNAPRQVPISSAPTPIRPVSGAPSPQVDLQRTADSDDMKAWIAARAKQGARWAAPGGTR